MPNEAPTDEQIVRVIAEKACGWKYYWHYSSVKLRPTDSWVAENGQECVELPATVDHIGWSDGRPFDPLTSIADAFMAVEKIGGIDLIKVDAGWMSGDGSGGFTTDEGYVETQLVNFAIADTPARAISLAIYAALEGK